MINRKKMSENSSKSEFPIWKIAPYKEWVRHYPGERSNPKKVYCRLCQQSLEPKRSTLSAHADTKKHKQLLLKARTEKQALPKELNSETESQQIEKLIESAKLSKYQTMPSQQASAASKISRLSQCHAISSQQSATAFEIPKSSQYQAMLSQRSAASSQVAATFHQPSSESFKKPRLSIKTTNLIQLGDLKIPKSVELKFFQLKLLLCSVVHSSISRGEHFTEILSGISDSQSHLPVVKAHGRKCIEMMKIVEKDIREKLRLDVGNQPYSIIINEYQWASEECYWCLCIKYFSERKKSIATNFLGLIRVSHTIDHDELGKLIIDHLENFGIDLQNLIGFGADAANWKLHTEYNSFYTSLSRKKPTLLLIPFLPHSLDICFSRAFAKLGDCFMHDYGYSWISIYNHFAQDPISSFLYTKIFSNVGSEVEKNFKNGISVSEESWLLGVDIIDAIVYHWDWLKEYFNESDIQKRQKFSMRVIFNNNKIHLYYIIISKVLRRVHRSYLRLTGIGVRIECFFPQLYGLLLELMQMIILPECIENLADMTQFNVEKIKKKLAHKQLRVIPYDKLDFGSTFGASGPAWETPSLKNDTIIEIKKGGMNLILELCRQIIERFPDDSELYEKLRMFSPKNSVKERTLVSSIADLPQKLMDFSMWNEITIHSQYTDIVEIRWSNVSSLSPEAFWFNIRDDKDKNGQYRFREIANLALKALSLPFGNDNIEYIFSLTKTLRTQSRDQIPVDVLDAIIRIRYHFFMEKLDCHSFQLTPTIVKKLKTVTCNESCDPQDIIFELIHSTAP